MCREHVSCAPWGPAESVSAELTGAVSDPSHLKTRATDRAAYAGDASRFLLTPKAVIVAEDAAEVAAVLRAARAAGSRVTFRSGGTSLSGQASGDDILIDTRRGFRGIDVLDEGRRVRVHRVPPCGRSTPACSGTATVSDRILPAKAPARSTATWRTTPAARRAAPSRTPTAPSNRWSSCCREGIIRLQRRVRSNPESVAIIRRQFAMKNTMGYGVNAFLDFDSPVQVLAHLIIGSEGTLAFVAEATFRTVPLLPRISTALAVFRTLEDATRVLPALVTTRAATLELMDARASAWDRPSSTPRRRSWGSTSRPRRRCSSQYHASEEDELAHLTEQGTLVLAAAPLQADARFSPDAKARATAWKLRKGLYASVAGARPAGATALLEDIVVPVPALASTCESLQVLFDQYGYRDSVIFGHAKDGNIHFMLTDRFEGDAAMDRFARFTEDMVDLVLGAGGNLKAEHGTGRVMAPFVRRQYGDELYDVMRALKRLCDPTGSLNPGVIITDDPEAHCGTSNGRSPSRSKPTDASSAATASRCARPRTSPSRPGSASSCDGRWRRRRLPATTGSLPIWRVTTTTPASTRALSTACARPRVPCSSTPGRSSSGCAGRVRTPCSLPAGRQGPRVGTGHPRRIGRADRG